MSWKMIKSLIKKKDPYKEYQKYWNELTDTFGSEITVGSDFEKAGISELKFLKENGLKKEYELLDIGCGCLRGGIHIIDYLNCGNYYGIDISDKQIKAAKENIKKFDLEKKKPIVVLNRNFNLYDLLHKKFDYIVTFSVFTHIYPESVVDCLRNIPDVLKRDGVFFATIFKEDNVEVYKHYYKTRGKGDFRKIGYNTNWIRSQGKRFGLETEELGETVVGQYMLRFTF